MQTESAQSTQQFVQNDASSRAGEASSGAGNHGEAVAAQSSSSQSSSGLVSSGLASSVSASSDAVTSESEEFGNEAASATPSASRALVPQGTVVLAATPIGNVHDASARLVALLQEADIVAAEDTRRLYDLANRLGVHVGGRVIAYHDHNEREKSDGLLDQVERGACVLVVSDAGMPTINDPGLAIVRRAIERGIPVTCAPGPSAVLDALALSGLPTDRFCYEGFLPRKHSERMQYLRTMQAEQRTMVFYETLHRIGDSMKDLQDAFGPNRAMALCRELTKDYEEIRRSTISGIVKSIEENPPRGEMVLVVAGASEGEAMAAAPASLPVEDLAVLSIDRALENGLRIKEAIAQVVAEHPLPDGSLPNRKDIYSAVLALKH
ncbi:16S rRNA (cytidine(1402)-2'-O)-methyltransferase [Bifidobacterium crudilactis]|uniref:16S rRNA (cytidine(1402)-2'-O)-methyltransferase n=1 Tax=Bifidobacterium crudilactis TaxID=327277 RepID=UPI000AB81B76|nr:16S rRNA (cytidine(1402)-2'-O)-methyltransferase [Bifidobacterium crudilactis]